MCFRFGSCLGGGGGQDYGRSTPKTSHRGGGGGGGRSHGWSQPDHGGYYGAGADHREPPVVAAEAGRDAYNAGGARKDHVDDGYAQDKAADEASKHPAAWSGKVGDDTGYAYTARVNDAAAADHRENAAADDHRYPTMVTTATHARY